ncbi:MAG: hypothetical protein ACRDWA_04945 [Acidimicrobiia bacterium]
MTEDPFDALRSGSSRPEPSSEERARALARLEAAIEDEQSRTRQRDFRRWTVAAAIAIAAGALAVGSLLQPRPAQAVLIEIAESARVATPLEVPQGAFFYVRSERIDLVSRLGSELGRNEVEVTYMLPTTREVWRSPTRRFIQIRTVVGTPQFFFESIETSYYAMGIDRIDMVGETMTQQLVDVFDEYVETAWPTDPGRLRRAMEEVLSGASEFPIEVRLLGLAANLLWETNPSPQLRAAILEVLAELPVDVEDQEPDGSTTISVTYEVPSLTRVSMTLSRDGQLLAEATTLLELDSQLRLPVGTRVSFATYELPIVVDSLNAPDYATQHGG